MILTTTRLRYAIGYMGLGLLEEAEAELAAIPPAYRDWSDVISTHAELAMAARRWTDMVSSARRLTEIEPNNVRGWVWWAYALREMQQIREARSVLLQVETIHGNDHAVVSYNLACYYCLLGEIDTARRHFSKACKMDPRFQESIATDPDLAGLRTDIEQP